MGVFELHPIDKLNDAEVAFVYRVRIHPFICSQLIGEPPACFSLHQSWVDKRVDNKTRWMFICTHKEEMVGYAQAFNFTDKSVEVGWALHPDHHGKGLGKKAVDTLLHEVATLFPNLPTVKLEVKENNTVAHSLYCKAGFQETARSNGIISMERPNVAPACEAEILYVGHAGFLLKHKDIRLLCDPWFYGAFYGSWYPHPFNRHVIPEVLHPTHIYISHAHEDHYDKQFLKKLDRTTPIIAANFKNGEMQRLFKDFSNVTYLNHLEKLKIGDVELQMFIDTISPKNDSAISIDFGYKILNSNDCYIPPETLPKVDMLWSQFSGAFHYPHCYDFDDQTKKIKVEEIRTRYLSDLKTRLEKTQCSVYVPSAGPACFLDPEQEHLNDGKNTIFYPWKEFAEEIKINTLKPVPGSRAVLKGKEWSLFHQTHPTVSLEKYREKTESERINYKRAILGPSEINSYFSNLRRKHSHLLKLQPKAFNLHIGESRFVVNLSLEGKAMYFENEVPSHLVRNYTFNVPFALMEDIVKGGKWDAAFLSNRIMLHRDKDEYDTVLFQLLYADMDPQRTAEISYSLSGIVETVEREGWTYPKLCPHAGADLSNAPIENGVLECPRHNWKWDLKDGKCIQGGNIPLRCQRKHD